LLAAVLGALRFSNVLKYKGFSGACKMSSFSVKASNRKINEGDDVSFQISSNDLTKGKKLYYKVVGSGINKSDFSSGRIKGSLVAGGNGLGLLDYTLKNDKKTEGTESFRVQVYADKKMKNLMGSSKTVRVFDTSLQPVRSPNAPGGKQEPINRPSSKSNYLDVDGIGRIVSGVTYGKNSDIARNLFAFNSPSGKRRIPSSVNYSFRATIERDKITGVSVLEDAAGSGAAEYQRMAFVGDFKFTKKALKSASLQKLVWNELYIYPDGTRSEYGDIATSATPVVVANVSNPFAWGAAGDLVSSSGNIQFAERSPDAFFGNFSEIYSYFGGGF
jgi:hypothetical protein